MAFDCNAAFLFQFHIIEHLSLGYLNGIGILQQSVGQCRLTMVDMRNDTEISNMLHIMYVYFFQQSAKIAQGERKHKFI